MMNRMPENVFPLRPRSLPGVPDAPPGTPQAAAGLAALIIDDEVVYRDGLKVLLAEIEGVTKAFEAATAAEAIGMARSLPQLGLIVANAEMNANANTIARLRHHFRGTPIIAVVHRHDRASVAAAFAQGAQGCLNRVTGRDVARMALTLVLNNECYVPADVCREMSSSRPEADPPVKPLHPALGRRQAEVLRLMLDGRTNKEIARVMGVLESTVKSHVKAVLRGLGVGNRTQAVIVATRLGWRPNNSQESGK